MPVMTDLSRPDIDGLGSFYLSPVASFFVNSRIVRKINNLIIEK